MFPIVDGESKLLGKQKKNDIEIPEENTVSPAGSVAPNYDSASIDSRTSDEVVMDVKIAEIKKEISITTAPGNEDFIRGLNAAIDILEKKDMKVEPR